MIVNKAKLGLVIRICHWNLCQPFADSLLLGTLIICSKNAQYFHQEFLYKLLFLLTEFDILFVLLLLNRIKKCLSNFPPKKQIFYYLPDLRN